MKHYTPKQGDLTSSAQTLTGSHVALGSELASHGRDKLVLFIDYTKGDETTMELKITSMTESGGTEYKKANESSSGGTTTVSAKEYQFTGSQKIELPVNMYGSYFKVYAKATGGTPTGTVDVKYRLDVIEK